MNKAQASSLSIAGHDVVSTVSPGATVEYGTYAQTKSKVNFTGVQLSGSNNAVFNLGTINLAESYWGGTGADNYNTSDIGNSFIEFVFNPGELTCNSKNGGDHCDFTYIEIILSQGSKTITTRISEYYYDGAYGDEFTVLAKANGQSNFGSYRPTKTSLQTTRKGWMRSEIANALYGVNKQLEIGTRGNSSAPLQLFYDNGCLYTTTSYRDQANSQLGANYLIRDFLSTDGGKTAQTYGKLHSRLTKTVILT